MSGLKMLLPGRKRKERDTSPDGRSLPAKVARGLSNQNMESATAMIYPAAVTDGINTSDRTEKYGLLLMNPQNSQHTDTNSGEDYALDVIAVHGITGDAYDTWTHQNGALWLRDFLPKDFPGARVFSFGYSAEVFCSRNTGDVESFARTLLEGITRERQEEKDQRRRIIFICHSMGGIVVKKALIIARLDAEDYGSITESISAILFLATPHRGSDQTQLPIVLCSIANIALAGTSRFTGHMRTDLIKSLEKDSENLKGISIDFRNQMGKMKIASFVEKVVTRPAKSRIVDDTSGIMSIPKERIIPMGECDHRSICRFSDRSSDSYRTVSGILKDFAKETRRVISNELSTQDSDCLHSLAFSEMTYRKQQADNAYPDTCHWILQHESYSTWQNMERGLLWIKGKPGAGKSTLMAFIHKDLKVIPPREYHSSLDFFFHGRGTTLQKTPIGMFRSLLHQLYIQIPVARERIRTAFKEKSYIENHCDWQLKELQDLFFNAVIDAARSKNITVFVDALDEAGAEVANDLADYLHRLNDSLDDAKCTTRICISCRHFPIVARVCGLEVLVEKNNHHDIRTYVQSEIQAKVQMDTPEEATSWQALEDYVVTKASGVFQWVCLVVPLLIRYHGEGESLACIREMLKKVPRELGDVYEHILKNVIEPRNWGKTLHLMQWICFAKRPLSVTALRHAINSDPIDTRLQSKGCSNSRDFIENDALMKKRIKSLSGGLAEINQRYNATVQFVHQSVLDFLLSTGLKFLLSASQDNRPQMGFSIEDAIGQSQDRLSRSCVNFFTREEVLHYGFNMKRHIRRIEFKLPFVDYASIFWFEHAREAESRGISQLDLVKQFESHPGHAFQMWLEFFDKIDGDLDVRFYPGSTLLHIASGSNLQTTLQALLSESRNVDARDDKGQTALHSAALNGRKEMITILLDAGADIEAKTSDHHTALKLAASNGDIEIVTLLLVRGASLNERSDEKGQSALVKAVESGNTKLVELLLKHGAEINAQGGYYGNALQAASWEGSEAVVRCLLEEGADVNAQGGEYGNALQAASFKGSETLVRCLLEVGANVNAQGGEYGNALQAASWRGSEAVVRLLLEKGAGVNAQGGHYGSALQAASFNGSKAVVRLLLKHGAEINAQGGYYGNALQAASFKGSETLVRCLLEVGANVNAQGGKSGNALQAASWRGSEAVVRLPLEKGAGVNAQGGHYGSALQAASFNGSKAVVRLLLEKGADVNAQCGKYGNALHAATKGFYPSKVIPLLKAAKSLQDSANDSNTDPLSSPSSSAETSDSEI